MWVEEAPVPRATLTLDGWARVELDPSAADSLLCLREVWNRRFDAHVLGRRDKRRPAQAQFDDFIESMKAVLYAEKRRHK
jgi:hypothetical protein